MIKTLEELKKATNEELLACWEEAQGNTQDLKKIFDTDYTYSTLTTLMGKRGFVSGMYIPGDKTGDKKEVEKDVFEITIQSQSGNGAMNLTMTNECKTAYKEFVGQTGNAYAHTTAALTLYMDLFKAGRLDVNMSLASPKKKNRNNCKA
ncbi:MAG: hypothetical protein J1E03_06975 [Acetatifactor sp.]|nr:hypothetical protein [Acetatifactor sp.]